MKMTWHCSGCRCIDVMLIKLFTWDLSSVLWHCWLGTRKSTRPIKIEWWGVGMVICLEQGADCLHMMPLHTKTQSSLASLKSRLVLPFWYRLTQVVLEKRRLNGCSSGSSCCCCCWQLNGMVVVTGCCECCYCCRAKSNRAVHLQRMSSKCRRSFWCSQYSLLLASVP